MEKISIETIVNSPIEKVWNCYTLPEHITQWNFAHPSWHCPAASNDMRVGGIYNARMEARDGSFGFNFEAIYTELTPNKSFTYRMGDREVHVRFESFNGGTKLRVIFDPENENPIEMQRGGWQSILDNFKNYTEAN